MSANQYTPHQQQAIEFFPLHSIKKHLVIEAGAGSGKTTILKERVKFLLLNKEFLPQDLVVITFTKNSTSELKHRISQLEGKNNLSEKVKFIHISTIDSFFASLVESLYPIWWDMTHLATKVPAQLSLLDEHQAMVDLEQEFAESIENFSTQEMCEIADFVLSGGLEKNQNSRLKQSPLESLLEAMLSDIFLSADIHHIRISANKIHPATQKLLEKCYDIARRAYEKRIEEGTFTYQDRNVFLKENLHRSCPLFFKELIVDEYQDTNHIQHEILWKLVSLNHAQMTVVGDPKQSIYAFRGSNVDVFQSLLIDPQWHVISLDVNFRSTQKLLSEVNTLSSLAFDWQTPHLPDTFKNSFFYEQAIKKSIAHKPLSAPDKKINDKNAQHIDQAPHVTLFEYLHEAEEKTKNTQLPRSTKREFNENNIKSLGYYLIEQVNQKLFAWKDVAILCEKNKQITKIKHIFSELNIPCLTDHNSNSDHDEFVNLIALSLFRVLHEGITNSIDLFYVLLSPLTPFTYEDILNYFLNSTIPLENQKIFPILKIIQKHSTIFEHQCFIAWQSCRSELANICFTETGEQDALMFCRQMDDFAQRVLSLSQVESPQAIKKILSQPQNSDKRAVPVFESENAVSIKTVHGAKGLEWDVVCFYPSMSKYEPPETFSIANSWPYLDINWLSEDVKSLSFLPKQQNTKFSDIDCFYHEEKEKHIWFSDLRNQLEKNFERKRIFYTAFTRPRKKLIFMHPERQGANAARQLDKKFKFSEYDSNFEQDVFLKYAYLTREHKTNAEHVRFSLNNKTDIASCESTIQPMIQAIPQPASPINDVLDFKISEQIFTSKTQLVSTATSLILQKQKMRRAAHHGIITHIKSENKIFSENSIQNLIFTNALHTWSEFEIWNTKNPEISHTERKIIDLLALFHKVDFEKILDELSLSCAYFKSYVECESEYVFLIIDFKSGAITNAGIQQVSYYGLLIEKICATGWFKTMLNNQIPSVFCGLAK